MGTSILRGLVTLTAVVFTTACFPVPLTYYKPTVPLQDVSYGSNLCVVPNVLTFLRQKVKFTISVGENQNVIQHGGKLGGGLYLVVPRGRTVTFDVGGMRAFSRKQENLLLPSYSGRYEAVSVRDYSENSSRDKALAPPPTIFSADGYGTRENPVGWYTIAFELKLPNPSPDIFYILIPRMTINGRSYPLLKVRFKKDSGLYLMPVNCG